MPDIWLDVDIDLQEVPVNVAPLIDDTDFKTIETGLRHNQAGLRLFWNFITTAGLFSHVEVVPSGTAESGTGTAGVYDWTDQGHGIYTLSIPATGGSSINNDQEGTGWFSGQCTGVLPWIGPRIGFRAAGINDKLIDSAYSATRGLAGTALPDAAALTGNGVSSYDQLEGFFQLALRTDAAIATDRSTLLSAINANEGSGAGAYDNTAASSVNVTEWLGTAVATPTVGGVPEVDLTHVAGSTTDVSTIPASVAAILADTNELQTDDYPARFTGIEGATFSTATDSLEALRNRGDAAWTTATGFSTHSAADVWSSATRTLTAGTNIQLPANGLANVTTWTVAITGNITGNLSGSVGSVTGNVGGNVVGSVASVTGGINTAAGVITTLDGLDTAQDTQHGTTQTAITALNNLSAAQVNAEVVDALNTDTYAEPSTAPGATITLAAKIGYLYQTLRNKATVTSSSKTIYSDAGAALWSKSLTDDGTTYTEAEGS